MVLKPKSNFKPGSHGFKHWIFKFQSIITQHMSFLNGTTSKNGSSAKLATLLTGFLFLFYIFNQMFGKDSAGNTSASIKIKKPTYPKVHGHYLNEIQSTSPLIFPHVDHAPILKEIGIKGLYILRLHGNGNDRFVLKPDDKMLSAEEMKKTTDQVLLVKRSFLDHGKLVYRKSDGPEVVLTTLLDFEKYDVDTLVRMVQNRVDYAQKHNYGLYIRWIQEFVPVIEDQNLSNSYDYIKPLITRAAMHAFPSAKHIMFIDQKALFMDMNISIPKHIMDLKVLEMSRMKGVPVTRGSNIRTYKKQAPENFQILIPQSDNGKLDMSCFITTTNEVGKAFMEFLGEPLVRNYPFEEFEHSAAHLFQWHPSFLAKTAVVVPKLFASAYDPTKKESNDAYHYSTGDFVVSFKGCEQRKSCIEDINAFYGKVKK